MALMRSTGTVAADLLPAPLTGHPPGGWASSSVLNLRWVHMGTNQLWDLPRRSVLRECGRCLQWHAQWGILNDMTAIDSVAIAMACRVWG